MVDVGKDAGSRNINEPPVPQSGSESEGGVEEKVRADPLCQLLKPGIHPVDSLWFGLAQQKLCLASVLT
jgi:hypothetical protein